ncbi:MAG TPA: hypothetical protein VNZ62_02760 [Capillimicrobium sp.]|nr:hypothetical protein [Capillimicrobium sp.]
MHAQDQIGSYDRESLRRTAGLAGWAIAWAGTLALARFGPASLWDSEAVSWAAVALNVAVGIGWIVAHVRFLRSIDELHRKVVLDALAVTFGVGWVGGLAYVVAENADLVSGDLQVFVALLGGVYVVAVAGGLLRYR